MSNLPKFSIAKRYLDAILSSGLISNGAIKEETKDIFSNMLIDISKNKDAYSLLLQNVLSSNDMNEDTKNFILSYKPNPEYPEKAVLTDYLDGIDSWNYDLWCIADPSILVDIIVHILKSLRFLDIFDLTENQVREFVFDVRRCYNDNIPYHNFIHCFDVFHNVYLLHKLTDVHKMLDRMDILTILVAALIHDVGHDGFSNAYHVNASTPLAMIYNDVSVLENYHCSLGYSLIVEHNILHKFNDEEVKKFKKIAFDAILATDLTRHHLLIDKLKGYVGNFDPSIPEHKSSILTALLKCADVSNPIKPFDVAKRWGMRVQEEFFAQGDVERANGLKSIKDMDREQCSLEEMQISFIENLVSPLYSTMASLIPGFDQFLDMLNSNKQKWIEHQ